MGPKKRPVCSFSWSHQSYFFNTVQQLSYRIRGLTWPHLVPCQWRSSSTLCPSCRWFFWKSINDILWKDTRDMMCHIWVNHPRYLRYLKVLRMAIWQVMPMKFRLDGNHVVSRKKMQRPNGLCCEPPSASTGWDNGDAWFKTGDEIKWLSRSYTIYCYKSTPRYPDEQSGSLLSHSIESCLVFRHSIRLWNHPIRLWNHFQYMKGMSLSPTNHPPTEVDCSGSLPWCPCNNPRSGSHVGPWLAIVWRHGYSMDWWKGEFTKIESA